MTQSASDISAFSTPLFYDKVAQELNIEISDLGHIDDLYPVCWIGYDDEDTYPEVYLNDGTKVNMRVMPDSTKSMSFFVVTGEMTEIDDLDFAVPMAYCSWMNLQLIDPTKAYDYTSEIIRDMYHVISKYGGYDINVEVQDPYPEFTQLSKQIAANTMRPYSGFRINFTKNVGICDKSITPSAPSKKIVTKTGIYILTKDGKSIITK